MQDRGRFERTLAATDDAYVSSSEAREVAMFRRVRSKRVRDFCKRSWTPRESRDTSGNHDAARSKKPAVLQQQLKALPCKLDARHLAGVDVRDDLLVKPKPVLDEVLKRDRPAKLHALRSLIRVKCQRPLGIRDM
jgi:hypothetical protein